MVNTSKPSDTPKFNDENMTDADRAAMRDETPETSEDTNTGEFRTKPEKGEDETLIVMHQQVPDGQGGVATKVHGPMLRGDWADYEKEHKL